MNVDMITTIISLRSKWPTWTMLDQRKNYRRHYSSRNVFTSTVSPLPYLTHLPGLFCLLPIITQGVGANRAGTKCFKASVHPGWSKRMKDQAARACGVCQSMLRLPQDVIDVTQPDSSDSLNAPTTPADPPKRSARKRYVRPPGEKPNLSTKMQYLYNELMASSKKNHNSPNYDPFSIANSDEVEDVDQDGKPFIVKSVIL